MLGPVLLRLISRDSSILRLFGLGREQQHDVSY